MSRVQTESQKLASDYNEEKARLERRMQEVAETARHEAERAAAEHQRQIEEFQDRLRQSTGSSAAEREEILRQLHEVKRRYEGAPRGVGFFGNLGRALDNLFGM